MADTPLPTKINPNPHEDADNKYHMFPLYFLLMMPNTIGSFARAYCHNNYSLAVLGLLVFSVFLSVDCYLPSLQITVALCTVVLICSVVLLYAFVITELVTDWKIRRSERHQTLDVRKLNHAYMVLEKV
ncbi:hypothetical protein L1987_46746 [Smallanthus sonchifolius]|uniref:Uncharacterized protein n=1 Tax=Smallanthus sonchifolius TaxID=185202 RepID=A0ACB9G0B2_9ASTR|nr:hypothetical protein L1987_46746 [Smallanthus sonchifolius]